jgi:hypothetical protein
MSGADGAGEGRGLRPPPFAVRLVVAAAELQDNCVFVDESRPDGAAAPPSLRARILHERLRFTVEVLAAPQLPDDAVQQLGPVMTRLALIRRECVELCSQSGAPFSRLLQTPTKLEARGAKLAESA